MHLTALEKGGALVRRQGVEDGLQRHAVDAGVREGVSDVVREDEGIVRIGDVA
jgi:hypothetical protein